MIATKEPVADCEDTVKRFNLLEITFNDDDSVKSYIVNRKKLDTMLLTAGFFASKTIGVDLDPLQAMDNYGMRDEQEKCFALHRAHRQDEVRHSVRRSAGENLRGLRLCDPGWLRSGLCLQGWPATRKRGRPAKPKVENQEL